MADKGPTLNPEYNAVLARWNAQGFASEPECEDCGKSLVGEDVHDMGHLWCCDACRDLHLDPGPDQREDFHADDGLGSYDDGSFRDD